MRARITGSAGSCHRVEQLAQYFCYSDRGKTFAHRTVIKPETQVFARIGLAYSASVRTFRSHHLKMTVRRFRSVSRRGNERSTPGYRRVECDHEQKPLGNSDLYITPIGFGAWQLAAPMGFGCGRTGR